MLTVDEVLEHNAEGCNYLLAVDVDMNTVSGYAMSSWDRGYGDFVFKPDLATLRRVPWQEGTALVLCCKHGIPHLTASTFLVDGGLSAAYVTPLD